MPNRGKGFSLKMNWNQIIEEYYQAKLPYISPRWARQLRYYLDFWKERLPHIKNGKEVVDELLKLPISNYTRNRYLTVLRGLKNWMEKMGTPFPFPLPSPFPNDRRKRSIPPVEALSRVIDNSDPELRTLLILMKNTLARVGELLELKWEDIDFENKVLFLHTRKTAGRGYKNIVIPLNKEAYEVLRNLPRKSEYVFPGKRGSKKMSYRWYALKKACEKAGIRPIGFHTFRHWAATSLARKGIPLTTIQALCGHSSIRTTERYLHAFMEDMRNAVEELERIGRG